MHAHDVLPEALGAVGGRAVDPGRDLAGSPCWMFRPKLAATSRATSISCDSSRGSISSGVWPGGWGTKYREPSKAAM